MEPGLILTILVLCGGLSGGYALGRTGRLVLGLLLSLLSAAVAWFLMFHSQLIGWDGMGPGIVAIVGFLPLTFTIAIGSYLGHWRARVVASTADVDIEAASPQDRQTDASD